MESTRDEQRTRSVRSGEPDEAVEIRTQGPRLMTLSISAYVNAATHIGEKAVAVLAKLHSSLNKHAVKESLWAYGGLSIVEINQVVDTSTKANGEWISQANFDVIFRVTSLMVEEVEFIERVSGTLTAVSDSGETHTIPLDVDSAP